MPQSIPDPSNFTTTIDNPYMTLRPGTTFVYADKSSGETNTFVVTRDTIVVDGVTCVVVHDTATLNGVVIEDTYDYFAQDDDGNVWYFGEATQSFEPGNPDPISTEGSWVAGVDGAEAGIVMLADPQVGDSYAQENAPGVAEDRAKVLSLVEAVNVNYGSFDEVLKTRDINPLDPSVEQKFYVQGVGNVLTTNADGAYEQLVRIEIDGTAESDELRGYSGGDYLNGRADDDLIFGEGGNDTMSGGTGADTLRGSSGFDKLHGGEGDDELTGGKNGDTFVFRNLHDGQADVDTITDYDLAQVDVINIKGGTSQIAEETFSDGAWELTLAGDGDVIRLEGVVDTNCDGHIIDNLIFA